MYIIKVNCISKIYSSKRKAHFFDLLKNSSEQELLSNRGCVVIVTLLSNIE